MLADALRLLGSLADPAELLGLLVLATAVLGLLKRRRLMLALQCVLVLLVIVLGLLPGGTWLALPLETWFPANPALPDHVDGIVLQGGTERIDQSDAWGQPTLSDPTPVMALVALARRYPDAKLVFTGGKAPGARSSLSEAAVVHDFLVEFGFDADRVIYEDRSSNTEENALFTHAMIQPKSNERWILVAQAMSLPRSVATFRGAGWDVIPFPAGFLTNGRAEVDATFHLRSGLNLASIAVHEWGGLLAYRVLGYTHELFPR